MDAEIERLENETRAAITANPLLVDKIRAQGQTIDYVAKKVAALHEKYALSHARHGLDPLEFLRKVTFDENYALRREAEIAAQMPDAGANEAVSDTETNEAASENAPVVEEASTPENEAPGEEAAPVEEAQDEPAELSEEERLIEERWLEELEAQTGEAITEPEPQIAEEAQDSPQSGIAANLEEAIDEVLEEEQAIQNDPQASVARDMEELAAQEQPAQETPETSDDGKLRGNETKILNQSSSDMARYEVWELSDIIPSHDPEHQFVRREDYPPEAQERPYHSDTGEQEKVRVNALNYEPAHVISTAGSAMEGPPVIARNGIVLGGNSRVMTLQLVYGKNGEKAQNYREALARNAPMFGIDAAGLENMRNPVLVRVVEDDLSLEDMALKSRLYNQANSQKLQEKAEGVSRARMISEESLAILAEALTADAELTLRKFMDTPGSKRLIASLQNDGVIQKTELSSLTDDAGYLNGAGKDLVESALRGLIIPNYDILRALPDSILNKMDRAIPSLARLKSKGGKWDLTPVLVPALRYIIKAKNENRKLDGWFAQVDMFDTDPDKKRPAVQALALTIANATQKELAARLSVYADTSAMTRKNTSMLLEEIEEEHSPAAAFVRAFMKPLYLVGSKPIADFDAKTNEAHAAIEWASRHGKTVEAALNAIQKELHEDISQERKEELRGYRGHLVDLSGQLTRYDPNLGKFFSYKKGEELFQDKLLRQKFDALEPVFVKGDEIFNKENPFPEKMADRRNRVIEWLAGNGLFKSYHNQDKGWDIIVSRGSIRSTASHGLDLGKAQILAALPEMLEKAIHIGKGRKSSRDIFTAKVKLGDEEYVTGIVIDTDKAGHRFLNYELSEIEKLDSVSLDRAAKTAVTEQNQARSVLSIVQNKLGVNDNIVLLQDKNNKRGSVTLYSDTYLVKLFEDADLSTLVHETGHIFFEELKKIVDSGLADEAMLKDYNILRGWLGAIEGEELTIEQREKAARGFEAYIMEGKAPSRELKSAFSRFKKWLLSIYRKATNLNVELTDEVRGVFDRMLASEAEINEGAKKNGLGGLTRKELERLGLNPDGATSAEQLPLTARDKAAAAMQEARNKNRKSRLRRLMREAKEEVAKMPVYEAIHAMRNTPLDPEALKMNFGEEFVKTLKSKVRGSVGEKSGVDPEIMAAQQGYENAEAMFNDILQSDKEGIAVKKRALELEAEEDAKFDAAEYLLAQRETSGQMELAERQLAKELGLEPFGKRAFEIAASEELAKMQMGNAIRSSRFLAAMRRNYMQFRKALLEDKIEAALDYNRKALLNLEFARQSMALAKMAEKLPRSVRAFVGSNAANPDVKYIVNDIAAKHGLMRESEALARGRDQGTIINWINSLKDEGIDLFIDDNIALGNGKNWREMSVDEFGNLVETLTQIIHAEKNQRTITTAEGKLNLDAVANDIANSIYAHNNRRVIHTIQTPPKVIEAAKKIHALHTKVEAICLAVDGEKMGPTWRHIYKPINDAENDQNMRLKKVRDELKKIFGAYSARELGRMGAQKVYEASIGEKISYENRICVALNMGNAVNIQRLQEGHGWTAEQINAVVKPLTAKDWNFVQSVWNYLETFKKESFDLQQEMTGIRPKAVEAQPLDVQTSDGQTLHLRGGYYPIRYNPKKGEKAFQFDEKELDKQLFGGRNYGAAATRKGHLKERSAAGLGTPLLLQLSVVPDHVFNVVHDLSYRRAVIDVAKVIRHKSVVEAFENTVGPELYHQLRPWLQDVANEHQAPMGGLDGFARWARVATSIMQMGYKVTTMVCQVMGITQTIDLIGYKWTAVGVHTVYSNPFNLFNLARETFARSSFMASRIQSFDRDVRDITKVLNMGGLFGWVDVIKSKAFVPMGVMQMGVDLPTWWGAYAKGLKENGGDEKLAAEYADSIVRQSQGSGAIKDLARIQRGSELQKLFTLFYSYFNTLYNLGARSIRGLKKDHSPAGIFRAANSALLLWFLPCILTELMAGRGPGDDENWGTWAGKIIIQYPFQTVVGLRDIVTGVFGYYG